MNNLLVRKGSTFELGIKADDPSAETARFQVAKDGVVFIDETASFAKKNATIRTNNTNIEIGDYEYMVTIVYNDGFVEMLPNPDDVETQLPKFSVYESISQGIS